MPEFTTNNQPAAVTKSTPFFTNYRFHPRFHHNVQPIDRSPQSLDTQQFADKMTELAGFLGTQMRTSQDKYENASNKNRTTAPASQIGDPVFLSTNINWTLHMSRKLDWK